MSDDDKGNNNTNKNNKNYYLSLGIAFGLIVGVSVTSIIGLFIESTLIWAFGPGLGMLIGIVIGVAIDYNKNKE